MLRLNHVLRLNRVIQCEVSSNTDLKEQVNVALSNSYVVVWHGKHLILSPNFFIVI